MMIRAAILSAGCLALGCASTPKGPPDVPYTVEEPAIVSFSGGKSKSCQGGCAFERAPVDALTPAQVDAFLDAVATTPVGEESDALNQLLFHDTEARNRLLAPEARARLPETWAAWLDDALSQTTVRFSLRIVDESGVVRAEVPETAMALGTKLHMEVTDGVGTGPFNANGTIVRVASDRVWIRM